MKIEKQIKLMSEMQMLFARMYSMQLSAQIKRGIAEKKRRDLLVKKSKV